MKGGVKECALSGSAVETGTDLAQFGVAVLPKLACGVIAFEANIGRAAGPVDGAAQLIGYCR